MSNSAKIDNSNLVVDALQKTAPELSAAIDGPNSWRAALEKRGARVAKYRRYERGDHEANLTTEMRKMLRLDGDDPSDLRELNINYCKIVVDKMAGRLHVAEITAKDDAIDDWIAETLDRNHYESKEGEMFRGAIRDADSFVLVEPITARWISQPAYDGFSGVFVVFNHVTNAPVWACKLWSTADSDDIAEGEGESTGANMKIAVYQPNRISFWKGREGTAEVTAAEIPKGFDSSGDGDNFIDWPLGMIPIVHFVNSRDNYSPYGESEIRVVLPPQNALNRTLHSMLMASDLSAFRIRWSKG
jgi:hypothetical protein